MKSTLEVLVFEAVVFDRVMKTSRCYTYCLYHRKTLHQVFMSLLRKISNEIYYDCNLMVRGEWQKHVNYAKWKLWLRIYEFFFVAMSNRCLVFSEAFWFHLGRESNRRLVFLAWDRDGRRIKEEEGVLVSFYLINKLSVVLT